MAALTLAAFFLIPDLRESGKALCNVLFDASEAVNAYIYDHFPVANDITPVPALILILLFVLSLYLLAVVRASRVLALILVIILASAQAYFGVPLPLWANVLAFALLGTVFLRSFHDLLPYGATILLLALTVSLAIPGIHIPTETASEAVRDRLSVIGLQMEENMMPLAPVTQKTQHENRLDKNSLAEDPDSVQSDRDYHYAQEQEQEISRPRRINWLKIIVILFLIVALLLGPFLPFLLLDSRRKKALERRRKFDSENDSEAICAIFLHVIAYLDSCGKGLGNIPFTSWTKLLQMPAEYRTQYEHAVMLWQEAAYSEHRMSSEQREKMRQFLSETEHILYDDADRKTRFRLKYLECLHE
ncbi:MAG: hypothetical protein PUB63_02875 [Clostridia bacterium]|nr:hypothetical protein [Clostridia bacterium]